LVEAVLRVCSGAALKYAVGLASFDIDFLPETTFGEALLVSCRRSFFMIQKLE